MPKTFLEDLGPRASKATRSFAILVAKYPARVLDFVADISTVVATLNPMVIPATIPLVMEFNQQ